MIPRPPRRARRGQRGVALILALLLVVAVAGIVAAAQFRSALDVRRTTNLVFAEQALAYQLGAEDWVAHVLREDAEEDNVDDLLEPWAVPLRIEPMPGVQVFGAVEDLQGRFNVNNLLKDDGSVDEAAFAQFKRLLDALGAEDTERVAAAVVDWIDADQDPRGGIGAEDSEYLRRDPPHRTADAPLLWVGELRAVAGVDRALYARLAPHLAALPRGTAINVNTATAPVLRSLAEGVTDAEIDEVVARQRNAPFGALSEFSASFGRAVAAGLRVDVRSDHFGLATTVEIEGVTTTLYSVIARSPGGGPARALRRTTDQNP